MPLTVLLDHLRRSARAWVALALVVGGAVLLPLNLSAAGAATPTPAVTPSAAEAPVVPGPDDLVRKPPGGELPCSPVAATCDDLTVDPCGGDECPTPPTPPCEENKLIACPPPPPVPCEVDDLGYPTDPDCPTPPPVECEKGEECPEPPPVRRPEPKPDPTDKPVPARPNFTG